MNFSQEDIGRELLFLAEGGVETRGDGLLDFCAGETVGGCGEFRQVERTRVAATFFQVNSEKSGAHVRVR